MFGLMKRSGETIGDRIRFQRNNIRMSQETLGGLVGVSRNMISQYEKKTRAKQKMPGGAKILLLSQALRKSTDWLLSGEESPHLTPDQRRAAEGVRGLNKANLTLFFRIVDAIEERQMAISAPKIEVVEGSMPTLDEKSQS